MTALTGIRVLELASDRIAFAGKLLADMGADVVLIEPPEGHVARSYPPFAGDRPDPEGSLWWWHHHTSKRGVTLALDNPADRERFMRLVGEADMLIESEPAGRLAELGLDYEDLRRARPDLIHVSVTPFGRTSANAGAPMTDLTIMAGAGPVWSSGYDDHEIPPIRGGGLQGYYTGCHFAVMSALTALLHRMATGVGQFIDVSFHQASNVSTEMGSYGWLVARETVQRQTGRHAMVHPSSETQTQCADGVWVNTGVPPRTPAEFASLLKWVGELELELEFPEAIFLEMGAGRDQPIELGQIGVDDEITAIFAAGRDALMLLASKMRAYDFFLACQNRALPVGIIYSPDEAFEDPHVIARGFQTPVAHGAETVLYPGAPYQLPASPWAITRRAPRLGEHNADILGGG